MEKENKIIKERSPQGLPFRSSRLRVAAVSEWTGFLITESPNPAEKAGKGRRCGNFLFFGVIAILLIGLSSCFKEKPLKAPSFNGADETNTVNMGPYYGSQFFFSLATNRVISSNSRQAYDLMFDDNPTTYNIWLNSANFPSVCATGKFNLDSVTWQDTAGHNFNIERGSYSADSGAIGQWWNANTNPPTSQGQVYIVNLGVDSLGNQLGFIKMQIGDYASIHIDTINVNAYNITSENMSNQNKKTSVISKDAGYNYNYLYLSFNNGVVNIEPQRNLWDLEFTHYSTFIYYDPTIKPYPFPYPVTGVLQNPSKVSAYLYPDTTTNFDSIKISNFQPGLLQTNRDAIGYAWKRYNGTYSVQTYYTYFVQTSSSTVYKLRFLSYYNAKGNDGYPTIEFVQF